MGKLAYFRVYLLKILYRLIVPLLYRNKQVRKAHLKAWTTRTEKNIWNVIFMFCMKMNLTYFPVQK